MSLFYHLICVICVNRWICLEREASVERAVFIGARPWLANSMSVVEDFSCVTDLPVF